MICLTFEREADDRIICHDRNELIRLELNGGTKFENRECICSEEAFQFDGYSTWFEGGMDLKKQQIILPSVFVLRPRNIRIRETVFFPVSMKRREKGCISN